MQPTVKISNLPKVVSPALTAKVPLVNGTETDYSLLSDLITLFFNNIPTGVIPGLTTDYVVTGGVWTGDSYAVNRNASMTAITVYLGQRSITIGAVTARTFTASKDTYIDVLNNLDGTGTLVYTEVTNNAASPALASNSIRIGIIVTGATTIAAAGSINQGQENKVLPIASSVPYSVADSLGNLICSRDPDNRTLLVRQDFVGTSTASASPVAATKLTGFVKVPTGRKIKATLYGEIGNSAAAYANVQIFEGTVAGTQQFLGRNWKTDAAGRANGGSWMWVWTPASANPQISVGFDAEGGGTANLGTTNDGCELIVELA